MKEQTTIPRRILRIRTVRERTGLSRSTIHMMEAAGDFPRRVTLGSRSVGWYEDEVTTWIESRQRKGA
jgi:prophage regulatory protein